MLLLNLLCNAVDKKWIVQFKAHSGIKVSGQGYSLPRAAIFFVCTKNDIQFLEHFTVRPSSDVVLLPCRTKLQLGSAKARQKHDFDSDVMSESCQIQDVLEPHNKPPHTFPQKHSPTKIH